MENKKHFPALDALRGVSFLLIFIFHALPVPAEAKGFGAFVFGKLFMALELFFVLSAFLLTYLGLKEWERSSRFSLKKFFARRVLRIWPLYFLVLFFGFVVVPAIAKPAGINITLPDPWYYLFFVSNYYFIDHVFFLKFLWTLSVEEQFYILLGSAIKWMRQYLKSVFIGLVAISMLFSILMDFMGRSNYMHLLTYFFDFGLGGLAAIFFCSGNPKGWRFFKLLEKHSWMVVVFVPVFFLVWYFAYLAFPGNNVVFMVGRWLLVLYFAVVILFLVLSGKSFIWVRNRFLVYSGKISYGLYCLHGIAITVVSQVIGKKWHLPKGVSFITMLAITYLAATISYYFFEKKFLSLKRR